MHVCTVCLCVHVHTWMSVHVCTPICEWYKFVCVVHVPCVSVHTMCIGVHVCTCMCAHVCVGVCVCMCAQCIATLKST